MVFIVLCFVLLVVEFFCGVICKYIGFVCLILICKSRDINNIYYLFMFLVRGCFWCFVYMYISCYNEKVFILIVFEGYVVGEYWFVEKGLLFKLEKVEYKVWEKFSGSKWNSEGVVIGS